MMDENCISLLFNLHLCGFEHFFHMFEEYLPHFSIGFLVICPF